MKKYAFSFYMVFLKTKTEKLKLLKTNKIVIKYNTCCLNDKVFLLLSSYLILWETKMPLNFKPWFYQNTYVYNIILQ